MRFQNLFFIILFAATLTGCSSCENNPGENTNKAPANSVNINENTVNANGNSDDASSSANTNDPFGDIETVEMPTAKEEAVTLKPLIETYCDAMRKGDDAALRKVFSAATIKSFEADMREEGTSSLAEFLSFEKVGNKCEVFNERIQGNVGEATVLTETYPKGVTLKFVKEGGDWKMTNQSADFDRVNKQ